LIGTIYRGAAFAAPRFFCRLALAAACALLASCAVLQSWNERADALARDAGFAPVPAGRFLRAYVKVPAAGAGELTIYIEGDGARWRAADQPPGDPTPENPLALRLAIADPVPAVAYIGRPCQYLDDEALAECDPNLWVGGRFSETAIVMVNQAVDALVKQSGARKLTLIGHSGGGTMAALVAARRRDVICLSSIASPLDTLAWTESIGVSPLRTSLNPADQTERLRGIPQTHFTGARDDVVPPVSIARYLRGVPAAREVRMEKFGHDCCWVEEWVQLRPRVCQ
jgi:pimeloyl-ACP methyl ester carboxylesterase